MKALYNLGNQENKASETDKRWKNVLFSTCRQKEEISKTIVDGVDFYIIFMHSCRQKHFCYMFTGKFKVCVPLK